VGPFGSYRNFFGKPTIVDPVDLSQGGPDARTRLPPRGTAGWESKGEPTADNSFPEDVADRTEPTTLDRETALDGAGRTGYREFPILMLVAQGRVPLCGPPKLVHLVRTPLSGLGL